MLFNPLRSEVPHGGYELIAGEKLRAVKLAGLDYIPAIIIYAYEQDSAIMTMINLQRKPSLFGGSKGYVSLIQDHGLTQEERQSSWAESISHSQQAANFETLNEIKEVLIRENLTERHAQVIKLPDDELQ